ncbi:MAG: hypothetical protein ACLRFL_00710 [Clostridia bacterium]
MKNNNTNDKNILDYDEIFKLYGENNFSNHAFPLYLFITRLYEALKEKQCEDVLFMSREGQFLRKLFKKYHEIREDLGLEVIDIKTHYFYGSRNSIMMASAKPIETEDFDHLLRSFKYFIKPKMFLFSIGFTDNQIDEVRKSFGKSMDKLCFNFKTSKIFKRLKQNEVFRQIYEDNRQRQSKSFGQYMKAFNIDFEEKGLVFVDIGYHGTMQDLIYKFFDAKVKITGYFIKNRAISSENNKKIGLLSDRNNKDLFGTKINKHDAYNYEQILRADHGRCLGYEFVDDYIATPLLDQDHDDVAIYEKYVRSLQSHILEKFEKIARVCLAKNIDVATLSTIYYYETIRNKSNADYEWILDMQECHHDDFGYVGYPGKAFSRGLKKFAFKIKDKLFICNNKGYVKKLKKNMIKNYTNR